MPGRLVTQLTCELVIEDVSNDFCRCPALRVTNVVYARVPGELCAVTWTAYNRWVPEVLIREGTIEVSPFAAAAELEAAVVTRVGPGWRGIGRSRSGGPELRGPPPTRDTATRGNEVHAEPAPGALVRLVGRLSRHHCADAGSSLSGSAWGPLGTDTPTCRGNPCVIEQDHADERSDWSGDPGAGGRCAAGVGRSSVSGDGARGGSSARVAVVPIRCCD